MFIPNIRATFSDEQRAHWLPRAEAWEVVGCYAGVSEVAVNRDRRKQAVGRRPGTDSLEKNSFSNNVWMLEAKLKRGVVASTHSDPHNLTCWQHCMDKLRSCALPSRTSKRMSFVCTPAR